MNHERVDATVEWGHNIEHLRRWDGAAIRDRMDALWESGGGYRGRIPGAWNIQYWRIHVWLREFFLRWPFTTEEERLRLSRRAIGEERIVSFLCWLRGADRWKNGGEMWRTSELPQILHECRLLDARRRTDLGVKESPPARPDAGPEQPHAKPDATDFLF